jgi:hypothetical protein
VSDAQSLLKAFEEKWQPIEPDAVRTFLKDIELTSAIPNSNGINKNRMVLAFRGL